MAAASDLSSASIASLSLPTASTIVWSASPPHLSSSSLGVMGTASTIARASTSPPPDFATNGPSLCAADGSEETEHVMKKIVIAVAVAFVAWYLFTEPQKSADVVHSALSLMTNAFDAVITFLTALFH